jgi:hypothetical protein
VKSGSSIRTLLVQRFPARHVDALLRHFGDAIEKFVVQDWEGVALKSGKFIEATTKALMAHCNRTPPASQRKFKAGNELRQLEQADSTVYAETVRLVIPKACVFAYEIVNNRGGRHDADSVDANEMDAKAVVPTISWVLAELVRFCSVGGDTAAAEAMIAELTDKTYPYFEDIDGRPYVNIKGLKAGEIALLLLYRTFPRRISRTELALQVARHGPSKGAAETAVHRLKKVVDDSSGLWVLRGLGRTQADALLRKIATPRS